MKRRSAASFLALAISCVAFPFLGACKGHTDTAPSDAGEATADEASVVVALSLGDAGGDGGEATSLRMYATEQITAIMSDSEWAPHDPTKASDERKGVIRLGYLRKGQSVLVKPQLVKKQSCLEGWY